MLISILETNATAKINNKSAPSDNPRWDETIGPCGYAGEAMYSYCSCCATGRRGCGDISGSTPHWEVLVPRKADFPTYEHHAAYSCPSTSLRYLPLVKDGPHSWHTFGAHLTIHPPEDSELKTCSRYLYCRRLLYSSQPTYLAQLISTSRRRLDS